MRDILVYLAPMVSVGLASDAPGSAATAAGLRTQLCALLTIGNAPIGGPASGASDFESVTQALLLWALGGFTAGKSVDPALPGTVSADRLAQLYQGILTSDTGTHDDFLRYQDFLAQNFQLHLRAPAKAPATSQTLFPMLPYLALATSDEVSVDFGGRSPVSPAYQQFLAAYFAQLSAGSSAWPAPAAGPAPSTTATESLAAAVLTDYFEILLRSVVQAAIDWRAGQSADPTVPALVAALAGAGAFNKSSSYAARFLLHGLRIPDPAGGVPASDQWPSVRGYPLFALTGQQWPAPAVPAPPKPGASTSLAYTMTFSASSALPPPTGLVADLPLAVALDDLKVDPKLRDGSDLVWDYESLIASSPVFDVPAPVEVPRSSLAPKTFALSGPVAWSSARLPSFLPAGAAQILPFSAPLRAQLAAAGTPVDLTPGVGSASDASKAVVLSTGYGWATRVDLSLRRTTVAGGTSAFVPAVYELHGASPDDREDLRALVDYLRSPAGAGAEVGLYLLYAAAAGGLTSDAAPVVALIKANLALSSAAHAVTVPTVLDAADPSRPVDFLTLLWESCVVDGGYFLSYRADATPGAGGLPAALFDPGPLGRLTLIATALGPSASQPVQSFHDVLVAPPTTVPDPVPYVQATSPAGAWLARRATLVPGLVGVQLDRPNPQLATAGLSPGTAASTQNRVEIAYNLLGAWVQPINGFRRSAEGLPAGPVNAGGAAGKAPVWTYRRVLPVAALVTAPSPATALPGQDPYAGVGSTVRLAFQYHDLFGNRRVGDDAAATLDVPLYYRDPLMPLNQWPAALLSWSVTGSAAAPGLAVTLGFDATRYQVNAQTSADALQKRAAADAARYQAIYFQIAQGDVQVVAAVNFAAASPALDRSRLAAWVVAAQAYAGAVAGGAAPPAAPVERFAFALQPALPGVVFPLQVALQITRGVGLVDPTFADTKEVQAVTAPVKPALAPAPGDTSGLRGFAAAFEQVFPVLKVASGDQGDGGTLFAVELQSANLRADFADTPHFFAPRPILTAPWSETDVDVQPYATGTGLGPVEQRSFRGADLDAWAADFLALVDRLMAPDRAFAVRAVDPAAWDRLVALKRSLAVAIRGSVEEILAGGAGGDLEAARDTLYEVLLVSLSEAYRVDALVQVPASVTSPAGAPFADPETAPRYTLEPRGVVPIAPGDTLDSIAQRFDVPLELIIALVVDRVGILAPGPVAFGGGSYAVADGDTIDKAAKALGTDGATLARALAASATLLLPGADLGLMKRVYTITPSDSLRTVLDFLAPDQVTSDVAGAIADFLDVNHSLPGIFAATHVAVGGASVPVQPGDTLDTLSARAGVGAADLVAALIDVPELLAPGVSVGFLADLPGFTCAAAELPLAGDPVTPRPASVTFPLQVASPDHVSNLAVSLSFRVQGLRYDIADVAWAEGYQDASWLSFVLPPSVPVGDVAVPIPLRVHPLPPIVEEQDLLYTPPASPTLADLRAYHYAFTYVYSRAAQDEALLSLVFGLLAAPDDEIPGLPTPPGLPEMLAQYASVQVALEADLALVATAAAAPASDPQRAAAALALQSLLTIGEAIGAAWATWQPPPPAPDTDLLHVVRQGTDAGGNPVVVVYAPPPALPGAPLPTVTPDGHEPTFQQSGPSHQITTFQPTADGALFADRYTYEAPGQLDVVHQQSAWGGVRVRRNHSLIAGQTTNPSFVYELPDVRFTSPAIPLFPYRLPFDMASVTTKLSPAPTSRVAARIADFLAELLSVDPAVASPTVTRIRVGVSFGVLLAGAAATTAAPTASLLSAVPVFLSPSFYFLPERDLLRADGFCVRLGQQMEAWLAENNPPQAGARWIFDVCVYAGGDGELSARLPPLLELSDVQLALADVT